MVFIITEMQTRTIALTSTPLNLFTHHFFLADIEEMKQWALFSLLGVNVRLISKIAGII